MDTELSALLAELSTMRDSLCLGVYDPYTSRAKLDRVSAIILDAKERMMAMSFEQQASERGQKIGAAFAAVFELKPSAGADQGQLGVLLAPTFGHNHSGEEALAFANGFMQGLQNGPQEVGRSIERKLDDILELMEKRERLMLAEAGKK